MATSDIDELLADLRGSEKIQRSAARECTERIDASWVRAACQEAQENSEAFTAGADQKARQIAAVEELCAELEAIRLLDSGAAVLGSDVIHTQVEGVLGETRVRPDFHLDEANHDGDPTEARR